MSTWNHQKNVCELQTDWIGRTSYQYDTIDSTNAQAKREAAEGAAHGTLIMAEMQTAGKGRRGRIWESPAGANLYFSLLLRPEFSAEKASMLTLVMALAVANGIKKTIQGCIDCTEHSSPQIKWPNDIVIHGKKVCGILTEMSVKHNRIDYVVIGVGINVNRQEFSTELAEKATSLEAECGESFLREEVLENILKLFERYYAVFEQQGNLAMLREEYEQMLVNRNREVCILDPKGEYRGIATGITETGELCVELPDGSTTNVYAGEVSVRGVYGYV